MRRHALLALAIVVAAPAVARAHDCIDLLSAYDKTFSKNAGAASTDAFTVPTTAGTWYLTVESQGTSSASVEVNGAVLFAPSDFNQGVHLLRRTFTPQLTNALVVRHTSSPTSTLRILVHGEVPDSALQPSQIHHAFERVFFTQTFARGSGAATIALPTDEGLFWLDVQNGDASGANRASSATIALNGVPVLGANDFSQKVGAISAPVVVARTNALAVDIQGGAGATVTMSLRGIAVDATPPSLQLVDPQPGVWLRLLGNVELRYSDAISGIQPGTQLFTANGTDVTLRFTVSDSAAITSLAALDPPLQEGANAFHAEVQDQACNKAALALQLLIDSRPPTIASSPADGAITGDTVAFAIGISDPQPGSGTVPSTFHAVLDGKTDVTASFSVTATQATGTLAALTDGLHVLTVTVADGAYPGGNIATAAIHFTVDKTPPELKLLSPAAATNDTIPAIVLSHVDPSGVDLATVKLKLDGVALTSVAQIGSATAFLPSAPLVEGVHQVEAEAADLRGNVGHLTTSFKVELTAKRFVLSISPSDPASVLLLTPNDLLVEAVTDSGLRATAYQGSFSLSVDKGLAGSPLDGLIGTFDLASEGLVRIEREAIVRTLGSVTITATALGAPSITGSLTLTGVDRAPVIDASPVAADGGVTLSVSTAPNASLAVLVDGVVVQTFTADPFGVGIVYLTLPKGIHKVEIVATATDGTSLGRSILLQLGPPVTVSGLVLDGSVTPPVPIAGVPVSLEGTNRSAITDATGGFRMDVAPVGTHVLLVDGYAAGGRLGRARAGLLLDGDKNLSPIVLRQVRYDLGTPIVVLSDGTSPALTVRNSELPFVRVDVPAGTITVPNGAPNTLTVTEVSLADLPIHVPDALASSFFASLGPEGVRTPGGLKITLPNGDGLTAGQTTTVWGYVPSKAKWEILGLAEARPDGQTLFLDPPGEEVTIIAADAPSPKTGVLWVEVVDENGKRVTDPLVFSGSHVRGVDRFAAFGPDASPSVAALHIVAPSFPIDVSVTATRYYRLSPTTQTKAVSATLVIKKFDTSFGTELRVGLPATVSGRVTAQVTPTLAVPVRGADVSCSGVRTVTDADGGYTLADVPVWPAAYPDDPAAPPQATVSASKIAGDRFANDVSFPLDASKRSYAVDVTISGPTPFTGPQFTSNVVASMQGNNALTWVSSLIYAPRTQRFYTANLAGNSSILEIYPNNSTAGTGSAPPNTSGTPGTFTQLTGGLSTGGLSPNSVALGGSVNYPGFLLAAEGHTWGVYAIAIDPSPNPGFPARGTKLQLTKTGGLVPPNGPVVTPLMLEEARVGVGLSAIAKFDNQYWLCATDLISPFPTVVQVGTDSSPVTAFSRQNYLPVNGAYASANGAIYSTVVDSNIVLPLSQFPPNKAAPVIGSVVVGSVDPVAGAAFSPLYFIDHTRANLIDVPDSGFTVQDDTGGDLFMVTRDQPVPGLMDGGSRVLAVNKSTSQTKVVYSVPSGKRAFGVAWGPASHRDVTNHDLALYVLQSDIQTASTTATTNVTVELVEVQCLGPWSDLWRPPTPDTDHDGLRDIAESLLGTNPTKADTDGDGLSDYLEAVAGTNPLDPNDPRPATVAGTSPPDGSTGVLLDETFVIRFNAPLNVTTVSRASVKLRDRNGLLVDGTVTYIPGSFEIVFKPSQDLAANSTYTFSTSGLQDEFGRDLTPTTETLTTGSATNSTTLPALKSDAGTQAAATAQDQSILTNPDTSGLSFQAADPEPGGVRDTLPIPLNAPSGTMVVNIPPRDFHQGHSGFFKVTFNLPADFVDADLRGTAMIDNDGAFFLNGHAVTVTSASPGLIDAINTYTFATSDRSFFKAGTNELLIADYNAVAPPDNPTGAWFYAFVRYKKPAFVVISPDPGVVEQGQTATFTANGYAYVSGGPTTPPSNLRDPTLLVQYASVGPTSVTWSIDGSATGASFPNVTLPSGTVGSTITVQAPLQGGFVSPGLVARTEQGQSDSAILYVPDVTIDTHEPASDDGDADAASVCQGILLHNGEARIQRTDLAIPGRAGLDFVLQRTYRSRSTWNRVLGHGWDLNYDERLHFVTLNADSDIVRQNGRGRFTTWRFQNGVYVPPKGYFGTLRPLPQADTYVLREPDGFQHIYTVSPGAYPAAGGFVKTALLTALLDRHGNRIDFQRDDQGNLAHAIDTYGRKIDFEFEPVPAPQSGHVETRFGDAQRSRLKKVTDFAGREVAYSYDDKNDLISVRSPLVTGTSTGNDFPNGRTEKYTYDFARTLGKWPLNHKLLTVTAPVEAASNGPAWLTLGYGTDPASSATFQRLTSRAAGGTNASGVAAGGTTTFDYSNFPVVSIVDANGNREQRTLDGNNHERLVKRFTSGLHSNEPVSGSYDTSSTYDDNGDGLLATRIFPAGDQLVLQYQSGPRAGQRNVVTKTRKAGPRGDGKGGTAADLIASFTYEPVFNQVFTAKDERGFTTQYFYDYMEGAGPVPQAEDLQITIPADKRNLGDLNGDSRVDQTQGSLVKVQRPTVTLESGSNLSVLLGGGTAQAIVRRTRWNDHGQVVATIDEVGNKTVNDYFPEDDPTGIGPTLGSPRTLSATDASGCLKSTTIDAGVLNLTTKFNYNRRGIVISTTNPRGIRTDFEVNALDEVVVMTRGASVLEATDLKAGEPALRTTAVAYQTRSFHDANGRFTRVETENRDFATDPNLAATGQFTGPYAVSSTVYDILGRPVESSVLADASKTLTSKLRYDANGNVTDAIAPLGATTHTQYDERDLVFKVTHGFGTADASTITIDYDENGNKVQVTDALSKKTTFKLDGFDRIVIVQDALGGQSITTYDPAGNATNVLVKGHPPNNPTGTAVRLSEADTSYDELNRPWKTVAQVFLDPAVFPTTRPPQMAPTATTRIERDALGRVRFVVRDDGVTNETKYDGASRVTERSDQLGNKVTTGYDGNGNATVVRSIEVSPLPGAAPRTFTTVNVYDQLDRLVRTTDNFGETVRYGYDSRNNIVASSDQLGPAIADALGLCSAATIASSSINDAGNVTRQYYDGAGRRVKIAADRHQDGTSNTPLVSPPVTLTYSFDDDSRLGAITDDNNHATTYGYDTLDRKKTETTADGKQTRWEYDLDSNVFQVFDANGSVITKQYDGLNRVTAIAIARGGLSTLGGTTAQTFGYDGLSRLTRATDDNGGHPHSCEYSYDSLGRTVEERQDALANAVSSQYDGAGKRLQFVYPSGRTIKNDFDSIGRVSEISDVTTGPKKSLAKSDWAGPGYRELRRANGNGTTLTYLDDAGNETGWDQVQRVKQLRVLPAGGGTAIVDRQYGYDTASQRTCEKRNDDFGLTDRWSYDSLHRVKRSDFDQAGATSSPKRVLRGLEYSLDGVGNRQVVQRTTIAGPLNVDNPATATAPQTYASNDVNEYTAVDGAPLANDDNGNVTLHQSNVLVWDALNRLVAVKNGSATIAEYEYYPDGRRAKKTKTAGGTKTTSAIFWDGDQEVEEQSTTTTGTGTTTEDKTLVWSPVFVDELVEYDRAQNGAPAEAYYVHQDARADVVAVTDKNGVQERYVYDDFGNAEIRDASGVARAVQASVVGNVSFFQGRRLDDETGYHYFRARYYSAELGRFVSRDPVWDAGNWGSQYSFCNGGPISGSDPMGLDGVDDLPWYVRASLFFVGEAEGLQEAAPYVARATQETVLTLGSNALHWKNRSEEDKYRLNRLIVGTAKGFREMPDRLKSASAETRELVLQGRYREGGHVFSRVLVDLAQALTFVDPVAAPLDEAVAGIRASAAARPVVGKGTVLAAPTGSGAGRSRLVGFGTYGPELPPGAVGEVTGIPNPAHLVEHFEWMTPAQFKQFKTSFIDGKRGFYRWSGKHETSGWVYPGKVAGVDMEAILTDEGLWVSQRPPGKGPSHPGM